MNVKLVVFLVAAILAAHALLIVLLLKTGDTASAAATRALQEVREEKEQKIQQEVTNRELIGDKEDVTPEKQDLPKQTSVQPVSEQQDNADDSGMSLDEISSLKPFTGGGIPPSGIPKLSEPAEPKKTTQTLPKPRISVPKRSGRPDRPVQRTPLNFKGARSVIPGLEANGKRIRAGLLIDVGSRQVLWAKNPDQEVPIASMSKIMTLLLAYEMATMPGAKITLETEIPVTLEAANQSPSKVYLKLKEKFTLRELMIAASVKSANDAAYLIAQAMGDGKVSNFIEKMNARALSLGMTHTKFFNPNGLPGANKNQDNYSTPQDMIKLCEEFGRYPELRQWSAMRSASFRSPGETDYQLLTNHNNLLPGAKYTTKGVDGIKTGYTNRAKYCVAVSCTREGRSLLAIITGAETINDRDGFARKMLDWGYKQGNSSNAK